MKCNWLGDLIEPGVGLTGLYDLLIFPFDSAGKNPVALASQATGADPQILGRIMKPSGFTVANRSPDKNMLLSQCPFWATLDGEVDLSRNHTADGVSG